MDKKAMQELVEEILALDADIEISEKNLENARRDAHKVYSNGKATRKELDGAKGAVLDAQFELESMQAKRAELFNRLVEALPGFYDGMDKERAEEELQVRQIKAELEAEAARLALLVEAIEGRNFVSTRQGLVPSPPSVKVMRRTFGAADAPFREEYNKDVEKLASDTPLLMRHRIQDERLTISSFLEEDPRTLAEVILKVEKPANLRKVKAALRRAKAA